LKKIILGIVLAIGVLNASELSEVEKGLASSLGTGYASILHVKNKSIENCSDLRNVDTLSKKASQDLAIQECEKQYKKMQ
jgi:hypothetical protein